MKKASLLILLLGFMVSTGFAQIGVSKGIIGGLNLATTGGADAGSDIKSVTGYAGGVYLELNLPGPVSVEAEGLYSTKGDKSESGRVTYTMTSAYIDIPVLAKFSFGIPAIRPYICAGPMYSTLLSAKLKTEVSGGTSTETDLKDVTASGDLGAVVGVGVSFASLRIDARYNYGLSSVDKAGIAKVYNRVISLYVGLSL